MTLTPQQALLQIEKGAVKPVYWIFGEETYFADLLLAALRKTVVRGAADFNFDRLEAASAPAAKVVSAAASYPVMAKQRLVLVRGAEAYDAESQETLCAYVERPLASTCLVFVSEKKPDQRRKFGKTLDASGGLVECRPVWESELDAWVGRMAKDKGFSGVDRMAGEVLFEYLGTNLQALERTIEKASLLSEGSKQLTEKIAREAVATSRRGSIFEVFDAAAEGAAKDALQGLALLYADGEKPPALLGGLFYKFKRLWAAAELLGRRASPQDVSREMARYGRPPHERELRALLAQARRLPAARCRSLAGRFYELDRVSKGGSKFPEIYLEKLILDLAR